MSTTAGDQRSSDDQVGSGTLSGTADAAAGESTRGCEQQEDVRKLRARGAELEDRLAVARSDLASALERREFMQEEAEQAREYSCKLAQEIARLDRIELGLLPDQRSALETLRRLIATSMALEQQEQSAQEEFRSREASLRAEIDDFKGGTSTGAGAGPGRAGSTASSGQEGVAVGRGESQRGSSTSGASSVRGSSENPLAEPRPDEDDDVGQASRGDEPLQQQQHHHHEQHQQQQQHPAGAATPTARSSLEGKALLSEGLHRIEAAHEAAAAEREMLATRLSRLRLAVARRQREEDATPGHAELLQYLLRFEELGRHTRESEKQLRRCQAERSTLALTREILADESRTLETIASRVDDAAHKQKAAREAVLRQLAGMIKGVEDSMSNQARLLEASRDRRRAAEETREAVAEEKKRFLKGERDLAEACMKHEGLKAHLSLMRR